MLAGGGAALRPESGRRALPAACQPLARLSALCSRSSCSGLGCAGAANVPLSQVKTEARRPQRGGGAGLALGEPALCALHRREPRVPTGALLGLLVCGPLSFREASHLRSQEAAVERPQALRFQGWGRRLPCRIWGLSPDGQGSRGLDVPACLSPVSGQARAHLNLARCFFSSFV